MEEIRNIKLENLKRGDKIYLVNKDQHESIITGILENKGSSISMYEYRSCAGYGSPTRWFFCMSYKYTAHYVIRHTLIESAEEPYWQEEFMCFDEDEIQVIKELVNGRSAYQPQKKPLSKEIYNTN